jgi:hypothetical protein
MTLAAGGRSKTQAMAWLTDSASNRKRRRVFHWRYALVLVAVCSLTVNVATRYSVSISSQISISAGARRITSHSPSETRQRLNKTATIPVTPVARLLAVLEVSDFYPRFAPGGPPVHTLCLDKSLYNRPSPSSALHS